MLCLKCVGFFVWTRLQTALVEGLAARVAAGDVPEPLQGVTIMALDMGLLMAGKGQTHNSDTSSLGHICHASAMALS